MKNHVRRLRERLKMTQRELAAAAHTSQQQITRIERGQAPSAQLAARIAAALGSSADKVFTAASRRKRQTPRDKERERPVLDQFEAGWVHTFKYRLRGGHDGQLLLDAENARRLFARLTEFKEHPDDDAVVFLSVDEARTLFLVNPKHLLFGHFVSDYGPHLGTVNSPDGDDVLTVWLADGSEPLRINVEADVFDMNDTPDAEIDQVQFQMLVFEAELGIRSWVMFDDEDGETVFLRTQDIAMLALPRDAVLDGGSNASVEDG